MRKSGDHGSTPMTRPTQMNRCTAILCLFLVFYTFADAYIWAGYVASHDIRENEVLDGECDEDYQCEFLHHATRCYLVNITDPLTNEVAERFRCICDEYENYYIENKICVYHARVGEICKQGESRCVDTYTECQSEWRSEVRRCACVSGTSEIKLQDGRKACAIAISTMTDPACRLCQRNGGMCYALQGNGKRDGCTCPSYSSGTDCENIHVRVICEKDRMTVCYQPHEDFTIAGRMYVSDHRDRGVCTAARDDTVCGLGNYRLPLSLAQGNRSLCHTTKTLLDTAINGDETEYTTKYENLITVEKKDYNIHEKIEFPSYCIFKTGHQPGQGKYEPAVALIVESDNDRHLPTGTLIMPNTRIHLRVYLDTTSGYDAVRVHTCSVSTSAHPEDKGVKFIDWSCPLNGQSYLAQGYGFRQFAGRPNELVSGDVHLATVGKSVYVHCRALACSNAKQDYCQQVGCERKKRTTTKRAFAEPFEENEDDPLKVLPDGVELVSLRREILFWQDNSAQNRNPESTAISSIDQIVIVGCVITGSLILFALCVMGYLALRHLRRRRRKEENMASLYGKMADISSYTDDTLSFASSAYSVPTDWLQPGRRNLSKP